MHAKALIDTGATISVISQSSLPGNFILNKFPGKIFDLTNSLNIIGSCQIEIKLADKINIICEVAVLGDNHEIPGDLIIGNDLLSEWQAVINLKDKFVQGVYEGTPWNIEIVCDNQENNNTGKVFFVHALNDSWVDEYCQMMIVGKTTIDESILLRVGFC